MRGVIALGLACVAACAASPNATGDGGPGDGGSCSIILVADPAMPVIGDHVRVTATVTQGGVFDYAWTLDGAPNTNYEAADHSAIGFDVPAAVPHTVSVSVTPVIDCAQQQTTIEVLDPSGQLAMFRLRVVPPLDLAPPQEVVIQVHGGQSVDRPLLLDSGERVQGSIKSGSTLEPGYLRFIPLVGPSFDAVSGTGNFDVHLTLQAHVIVVVPNDNTLAPKLIGRTPGSNMNTFQVDTGTAWSGTVLDRSGAALANAQVQLTSGGVPSTLATTNGSGAFTVHHTYSAGSLVTVTVTPPAGTGLARLQASATFDQSQAMTISYAGSPATCDLSGTPVKRGGANQAGAKVTIVGTLATVGSVTTGAVMMAASGEVHVAATASGTGTLPAGTLVPRASLSAVAALTATDLAVAALDTSPGCTSLTITAPAMLAEGGTTRTFAQVTIGGVHVSATPVGALGMASLIPVEAISAADGNFSLALAAGGHYSLRFTDPGGRGAPLVFDDLLPPGVPALADLPTAVSISGDVSVVDDPNPIESASVQLLCTNCSGIAASLPIAQTATDIASHYRIAAPDPGM